MRIRYFSISLNFASTKKPFSIFPPGLDTANTADMYVNRSSFAMMGNLEQGGAGMGGVQDAPQIGIVVEPMTQVQ